MEHDKLVSGPVDNFHKNSLVQFIFICIIALLVFSNMQAISKFLLDNFATELVWSLVVISILIVALVIYSVGNLMYVLHLLHTVSERKWLKVTVLMMGVAFFIGTVFFWDFYGYSRNNLDSKLNDNGDNGKQIGTIDCEDYSKQFLVGSMVNCTLKPDSPKDALRDYNSTIKFTFINGSTTSTEKMNNYISFIAPPNTIRIDFYITGLDENNSVRNLGVARTFTFYNYKERIQRNYNFVASILGLFGIVIFAIPNAVVNFKDLLKTDD